MGKIFKATGIFIWVLSVVVAINAFIAPGNLPQGLAWRAGLWVITAAFGLKVLQNFLWSKAKRHWAAFLMICLFLMYATLLYLTAIPGLTREWMRWITVLFTFVPLIGLLILLAYRKSEKK